MPYTRSGSVSIGGAEPIVSDAPLTPWLTNEANACIDNTKGSLAAKLEVLRAIHALVSACRNISRIVRSMLMPRSHPYS